MVDAGRLDLEIRDDGDPPAASLQQPARQLVAGDLVVEDDAVGVDQGVVAVDHDQWKPLPLQLLVQRLVPVSVVRKDDDSRDAAGDRLLDVQRLVVVRVVRADHLEVVLILGRRAGDAHEHVKEVWVIQLVTDEGD